MNEIDGAPRVRRHPAVRVAFDLALPMVALVCFVAPAVATFASTPPVAIRAVPDRTPVIHVEPFEDLAAGSCFPDPRLHLGPSSTTGTLSYEWPLRTRVTEAVSRCDLDWFGAVTVTVKLDGAGAITDVTADAGSDGRMRTCVIRNVRREGPVETRGPGALTVGYFMGARSP